MVSVPNYIIRVEIIPPKLIMRHKHGIGTWARVMSLKV